MANVRMSIAAAAVEPADVAAVVGAVLIAPVKRCRTASLSAVLAITLVLLGYRADAQTYEGRQLVQASLVADTNAVVPGKPFTVGLLLHMVPGWHTYWKFPGDAGIPTELNWKLPAGWSVGELEWPLPLKLDEPGDIQIYGYHDEVLLMQQVTPPASLGEPGSTVQLTADANWLVCEQICIPGSARLKLDLPIAAQAQPANQDLFDRFRKQLPQSSPANVTVNWGRYPSGVQLIVEGVDLAKSSAAEFYPSPPADIVVGHPIVLKREGTKMTFQIPVEAPGKNISSVPGVVVLGDQSSPANRIGWTVAASASGSPAAAGSPKQNSVATGRATVAASAKGNPPPQSLATLFFFGFLGGLILNLMPCVLPVISLKIFGFVQQAGQSRRRIFRSGLAFAAGIFAWFIGLGFLLIALKSAGHQIAWAFQFTNPYFVFGMSVLVLVFALNLFGVFEVILPQTANRGMLEVASRAGDAGSFFHGVFATLLATPCTAPYLGTALGFAFTQSAVIIMAMFLSIAAGMALPYVLLCAQPAWLRFLPKPGPWMTHLKQLMGFLLLATLLFLLYVIGAQRGLEGLIWTCSFLLVVSLACWIAGTFLGPSASARARAVATILILVLLAVSGVYFIGNKFRTATNPILASTQTGDWQNFSPALLQAELRQGHSVFVDFTAAWCLNCKFNEAHVLESAEVRAAFKKNGVTKLKADWTNGDPVITKILQQFGRVGVPFYVLYPGDAGEPVVFPELLTKTIVLEKLEGVSRRVASQ